LKGRDFLAAILIRTVLIYLILIFTLRLSGKRQIGEMQISELVTTFLLSELASIPLTNPAIPFLHAVIPILTIVSVEIIFSFLTTKWTVAKRLLDGRPSIIIKKGKLQKKEMERMRLSLDDLLCELRLKDIATLADVDYAILEPNGKLSVFQKNTTPLSHVYVIDGDIQTETLKETGKDEAWIKKLLQGQNVPYIKEVFLLSVTDDENVTLIRKEDCQ
jgi:uncharacterized membrane protein YcaP (DUF421 family)